jgi:hypothetical protein
VSIASSDKLSPSERGANDKSKANCNCSVLFIFQSSRAHPSASLARRSSRQRRRTQARIRCRASSTLSHRTTARFVIRVLARTRREQSNLQQSSIAMSRIAIMVCTESLDAPSRRRQSTAINTMSPRRERVQSHQRPSTLSVTLLRSGTRCRRE